MASSRTRLARIERYLSQNFLSLMPGATPEQIGAFFDQGRIGLWVEALTDQTILGKPNYDRLEKDGDSKLEAALVSILLQHFPTADPGDLNGFITYYRSNEVFAAILDDALPDISGRRYFEIIKGIEVSNAIKADIFEALFGALAQAAENITRGLSGIWVQTIFEVLLRQWLIKTRGSYEFDPKLRHGPPSTQYIVIFNKVQHPKLEIIVSPDFSEVTAKVRITQLQQDYINRWNEKPDFRRKGKQFIIPTKQGRNTDYIFSSTAPTKEIASREAFQKALDWLGTYGVDVEWADLVKYHEIVDALPPKQRTAFTRKLKQEGYAEARLGKLSKHTIEGHRTVAVLKARPNDDLYFHSIVVGVGTADTVYAITIQNYLEQAAPAAPTRSGQAASSSSKPMPASGDIYDF